MPIQLYLNATSPFARLARAVALEKELKTPLELVWCDPWADDPRLLAVHPQGRIPVLQTPSGQAIAESLLIAQWLDQHGAGVRLVPEDCAAAAQVLATTSMAYGLMETAFSTVIQRKYVGEQADAHMLGQRRLKAMERTLDSLETQARAALLPSDDIARLDALCICIALEYVAFRLPNVLPMHPCPTLHQWAQHYAQRPSLASTRFAG